MQQSDYRFSRREIREATGWTEYQVRIHMQRLMQMEYVFAHHGSRGQSFVYELAYDGNVGNDELHLNGLLDVQHLKHHYDNKFEGQKPNNKGPTSTQRAPNEGGSRGTKTRRKPATAQALEPVDDDEPQNRGTPPKNNGVCRNGVSRSSRGGIGHESAPAMMASSHDIGCE